MFTDSTQWDRVCTFSADKLNELGQVSLFAKKLHALEAEHARDLAKLCEKFLSGVPAEKRGVLERVMAAAAAEQDDGAEEREEPPISLGATWASVLEEMALRARRAELVADRLDAQVVRPLGHTSSSSTACAARRRVRAARTSGCTTCTPRSSRRNRST